MYPGLRLGVARCYSLGAGAFIGETVQLPAGLPENCPEIGETVQLSAGLPENCPEIGETVQLPAGLPSLNQVVCKCSPREVVPPARRKVPRSESVGGEARTQFFAWGMCVAVADVRASPSQTHHRPCEKPAISRTGEGNGQGKCYPCPAARLRLTMITPPTMSMVARIFCQVRLSIPEEMLTTAAIIGCR